MAIFLIEQLVPWHFWTQALAWLHRHARQRLLN